MSDDRGSTRTELSYESLEAENEALRQHVGELERRIVELESELAQRRQGLQYEDLGSELRPILALAIILLLATIPPTLVVWDRWLDRRLTFSRLQVLWCKIDFLCNLVYPSYFALIFVCFIGVLVFFAFRTERRLIALRSSPVNASTDREKSGIGARQSRISRALLLASIVGFIFIAIRSVISDQLPGWELVLILLTYLLRWSLRERPLEKTVNAWLRNKEWLIAILLAEVSLVTLLAGYFAEQRFHWIFAFLLLLSIISLWRYFCKISFIIWIVTLAIILFTLNINAWWLSGIGDEGSFFFYARDIIERQDASFISSQLFNGQAVYGTHPYFSSLIQASFMGLFGINGFGWRFSNVFVSAAAIGFFFLFFEIFVSRRTALIASLFLAVSHYLMSFGTIGYNNLQALFAMSLALWAAGWAVKTKRLLASAILGVALGLCFYVYPAALYVLPLPVLLVLFYDPPTSGPALHRWVAMASSLLMFIFPLFLQPGYWKTKVVGTLFYNPQLVQTIGDTISHLTKNLLYALFSFVYIPHESHFVASSYVDPLTAVFTLIGIGYLLRIIRRKQFATFCIISFAILLFLVGASHDRDYPPNTRMFLLLPWFALLAAIGLTWILNQIEELKLIQLPIMGVVVLVFLATLGLNLHQAYPLARDRMAGYQTLETLFFRLVQRAQATESAETYVFITDPTWTSSGIQQLPNIYPVQAEFEEVIVTDQTLPEPAKATIADKNALVIIKPWMEQSWQKAFEPALRDLGKVSCGIKTTTGDVRFTLWHSPKLAWLCK